MTPTSLSVHAHFYQPPRENPWTEEVPREPSAGPFHDWNTRIAAESYRPNAFARVLDGEGRVLGIVNNYELLSFNVGPTLMSWLERHQPDVYDRIRAAHAGSGGAIAQAWNHMILPLASERDVRTQIRWGLADFRHRFGVEAAGMWLPETAVNPEVLRILAEEGVGFTILAPSQAAAIRPLAGTASPGPAVVPNREWQEIAEAGRGLDTRVPYRWLHPSGDGRGVDLVFYDGGLSHALAFEAVSSEMLVDRAVAGGGRRGGLVAVALDGETFGHHRKWADRALAYALTAEAPRRGLAVTNMGGWLRRHRPVQEVQVRESAWSCTHGVGRWSSDCGCSTGGPAGSDQRWRAPLREALDLLRDFGAEVFERRGPGLFAGDDPWRARDAYVDVLIGAQNREEFAARHVTGDPIEAFTLLEAQRNAMLMYTSCGWFFHDLAGLETVQVLRYAARVLDLLAEVGEVPPEAAFLDILGRAQSFGQGDGREVWSVHVLPARVDAARVASHLVLGDLFGLDDAFSTGTPRAPASPGTPRAPASTGTLPTAVPSTGTAHLAGFDVESLGAGEARRPAGDLGLAWRWVRLTHGRTGRSEELVAVALRLGGVDTVGAVRPARWPSDALTLDSLRQAVSSGLPDPELADRLQTSFGTRSFDTSAILPEAAEALLDRATAGLADHLGDAVESFLAAARWAGLAEAPGQVTGSPAGQRGELPAALRPSAEVAVAHRLQRQLAAGELEAAVDLARRARSLGLPVSASPAGEEPRRGVSSIVLDTVRRAVAEPGETTVDALAALELAAELGVEPDLDEAQELVYALVRGGHRPDLEELALALNLSPALFEPEAETPVPVRTSA